MKVDVNYVKALFDEIKKINSIPFHEIEWYEGSNKLHVPQHVLDTWKFVGMTNCSFVETGSFHLASLEYDCLYDHTLQN